MAFAITKSFSFTFSFFTKTQGNKTSFVNAPEDENYFLGVGANSALLLEPKWKPLSSLKTIKVN